MEALLSKNAATMMKVLFNDKEIEIVQGESLADLLMRQGYNSHRKFAVAVNQEFVPRGEYEDMQVKNGDQIDVVSPMQGG